MTRFFKTSFFIILCLALLIGTAALLIGCKNNSKVNTDKPTPIGKNSMYKGLDLEEYVSLCGYTGLELDISSAKGTREDMEKAVKNYVFGNSEIKKYPEDAVSYYFEQEKALYMHLAENDTSEYIRLLETAGISESDFEALAKKYVAEDLIFYAIAKDAGISLTEDEKSSLFDKYAKQFSELYDYSESYIKENMTELIYDSMLYDKTMEFLIENNKFVK